MLKKVISLIADQRVKSSFAPASANLLRQIADFRQSEEETVCTKPELWEATLSIPADLAGAILTRDLPSGTKLACQLATVEGAPVRNGQLVTDLQHESFSYIQNFDLTTGTTSSGLIKVKEDRQYAGLGRTLLRNEIEFAHAAGLKTFNIVAAETAGAYTWARFGFLPSTASLMLGGLPAEVGRRFDLVKNLLTPDESRNVIPWSRMLRPKDIWHVAGNALDLAPRLREKFNQLSTLCREEREFYEEMQAKFGRRIDHGKPVTLGQVLLAEQTWAGFLDLTNSEQMKRAGDYAGGWKYIGFERKAG